MLFLLNYKKARTQIFLKEEFYFCKINVVRKIVVSEQMLIKHQNFSLDLTLGIMRYLSL